MKIPTYILGLLLRHGDQHGYQIKKNISKQVSDFANIKLPTIYYHLEKLEKKNLIVSHKERTGKRPEKDVYSITAYGKREFMALLSKILNEYDSFEFKIDTVLFFADYISNDRLIEALQDRGRKIVDILEHITQHKSDFKKHLPKSMQMYPMMIFNHHEMHHQVELQWIRKSLEMLDQKKN